MSTDGQPVERKRGRGRPKGTPASDAQKATAPQARKASAAARAKRKAERERSRAELEVPRWRLLENGDIAVSDLTDEELLRGEVANSDGSWEGRRHVFAPRMIGKMNTEYKRRIKRGMEKLGMLAIETIEDILMDDDARAQQAAMAKMVVEYNIGKVPDVVHVGAETEWDRLASTGLTILRGVENVVDEDIVDAELVEE